MVLIAVLAVLCIFALIGMKKGVIKIAVSLATMVITIAVTTFAAPVLSEYIRNNTKWEKSIYENVSRDGKSYGEDDEDIAGEGISAYIDDIEEKVAAISEKMNLPDSLTKSVSESVTSKLVENVEESATLTLKDIASKIFAAQMAAIIVNAVSYCIVFIVLFIILKIITAVTGIISRLPVIHQADRLGGFVTGLVEGLIVVWLMFAIVTAAGNSSWAADILAQIHSNSFLEFVYNNNLIMKIILV